MTPSSWNAIALILIVPTAGFALWVLAKILWIGYGLLRAYSKPFDDPEFESIRQDILRRRAQLCAMSTDDAQKEALRLLEDPTKFRCVRTTGGIGLESLAGNLTKLFSKFESIATQGGETILSRRSFRQYGTSGQYLEIGGNQDGETFLVRMHDETIYAVHGYDKYKVIRSYAPTVYHWIIIVHRVQ